MQTYARVRPFSYTDRPRWQAVTVGIMVAVGILSGCGPADGAATPPAAEKSPEAKDSPRAAADPNEGSEHDAVEGEPGIPAAAMLRPSDLGEGFRARRDDGAHWWLEFVLGSCSDTELATGPLPTRTRILSAEEGPFTGLYQSVKRFGGDSGSDHLAGVRAAVEECSSSGGRLSLVDSDLAGEESYLVADEYEGTTRYYVLIRQGEVRAEILLATPDASEDRAREIAGTAAERLCEATETC